MQALGTRPATSDKREVGSVHTASARFYAQVSGAANLTGKMLNKLGRLGQQGLQASCNGKYVASNAIRLTRRVDQMRPRNVITPTVVTKTLSSNGELTTQCLELARACHGSKFQGTRNHKSSELRTSGRLAVNVKVGDQVPVS